MISAVKKAEKSIPITLKPIATTRNLLPIYKIQVRNYYQTGISIKHGRGAVQ